MAKLKRKSLGKNTLAFRALLDLRELMPESGIFPSSNPENVEIRRIYHRLKNIGLDWKTACRLAGGMSAQEYRQINPSPSTARAAKCKRQKQEGEKMLKEEEALDAKEARIIAEYEREEEAKRVEIIKIGKMACRDCMWLDRNGFCPLPENSCAKKHKAKTKYYGTFG